MSEMDRPTFPSSLSDLGRVAEAEAMKAVVFSGSGSGIKNNRFRFRLQSHITKLNFQALKYKK